MLFMRSHDFDYFNRNEIHSVVTKFLIVALMRFCFEKRSLEVLSARAPFVTCCCSLSRERKALERTGRESGPLFL